MKNNILIYLLGVLTVVLLSFKAGEEYQKMYMTPAKPKSTVVLVSKNNHDKVDWQPYVRQGYQIQQIAGDEYKVYVLVKY